MKAKLLTAVLVICILCGLAACGSSENGAGTGEEDAVQEETNDTVEVDENLLTVDVTLPASLFEDTTEADIQAGATEKGFSKATVNPDGSVTYTMTKARWREATAEFKEEVDKSIDDMLNGAEAVASFQEISYNQAMSEFTVKVDKALYSEWDAMYALVFYLSGGYYQAFSGVPSEDVRVVVNFVDAATGEVLNTGDSAQLGSE